MVNLVADVVTTSEEVLDLQRELLRQCVDRLEPDQRTMLMAAYQPKAKIQEVARGSGRTVGGFYQWLHRMRKLLLDCVQSELAKVRSPRPHMP
jgi:RNA polymerase sigma-70 factor (ECF subfamily)